jgi:hypothetical protein
VTKEAKVADEFAEIREMRERFLKAAYDRRDPGKLDAASNEVVMRDLGLEPDITTPNGMRDTEQYDALARYWKQRGYIEYFTEAMVRITAAGMRHVEEGEHEILQPGPSIHIAGSVYASPIATSGGHIEMQNFFTFGELDRLIEERGGENRDELHRTAQELRQQLEEHDTVSKGWLGEWLVRHSRMLNEHAWIVQPLAVLLLTWGTGQPPT